MTLKLSDLILSIGDKNIQLQNLDQCADTLDWTAKKGTKITFGTEVRLTPDGTERLGMVIWLDRKAVADAIAKSKEPSNDTP